MFSKNAKSTGKKDSTQPVYSSVNRQMRFESLVKAYANDLYRFAFWLCNNESVADDLVQETFLRAWKSLDSLLDEKKAKPWLITILRRENARRFERKQLEIADVELSSLEDIYNTSPEKKFELHQLHRAIFKLDIDYREPLLLQIIGGFKTHEIAEVLALNLNTVNTRLFRAREQLKKQLHKDGAITQQKTW